MKVSEKKRQLLKAGCYKVREGTNHEVWYSPITGNRFPISRHDGKELPTGTAKIIDKQAGLP
ncbi:MAG: type II toxin-antitoxin system HicA family toxin [Clostridiales bacterium]|jgi:mRNA interferase HicA|nr:type II toxin-antitoxin system HicA family toxin [Clostridiales bacterium]